MNWDEPTCRCTCLHHAMSRCCASRSEERKPREHLLHLQITGTTEAPQHMFSAHVRIPTGSMTSRLHKRALAIPTAVTCFGISIVGQAQDDGPAVVPYRPSVATPADLPAPG